MSSPAELKRAVMAFMEGYSVEATPHDSDKLESFMEVLAPGAAVYVAHPPGTAFEEIVELAGRVRALGLSAVPHIISRRLESVAQLERGLERLRELDIDRVLVLGGDQAAPNAAFDSSLEVLQTGLLERYGFTRVGIAGHPEGSKAIGDARARQALEDKAAFAKDAPFEMYIATQFGFDPEAVTRWEEETTAGGVTLPIHAGVAGPASLRQLARFAVLCGVGASARMLMTRTGATANLLRTQAPDDLIVHFARHKAAQPASRLAGVHFFCFGGVVKTARWANAVRSGDFELNSQGTGFKVG